MGTQGAVERAPWTSLLKQSQAILLTHATNLGIFLQQKHPEPTVTACIGSHRWLMSGVCNSPHEAAPVPPYAQTLRPGELYILTWDGGKKAAAIHLPCSPVYGHHLKTAVVADRFAETWVALNALALTLPPPPPPPPASPSFSRTRR